MVSTKTNAQSYKIFVRRRELNVDFINFAYMGG